jgi:catechol 2,3-dioxygenase-like lactoylglutathione lyase family enzyme
VAGIELPSRDLPAACNFYCGVLGFTLRARDATSLVLEIGGTELRLRHSAGRPIPADSRSHDRWFRHLAIAVRDMAPAYRRLRDMGVAFISEPVSLPKWNAATAGIEAVYLRDLEGRPLELIAFPPDKGHDDVADGTRPLYLGIDHTAIVVADLERSVTFYEKRYGLRVENSSHNHGPEQARLCGLEGADVAIASLRGNGGIGLELLEYRAPRDGRDAPADTTDDDVWSGATVFARDGTSALDWSAPLERDRDGHRIREPAPEPGRLPANGAG